MENKKILVVDDEYYIVDLIKRNLESDYDIITAYNGKDALDMAESEKPDLILLDIMLPKIDGMEVCRLLKKSPVTYDIPVIILTCRTEVEMKVTGLDTGADDYITKPFDLRELRARIKALLRLVSLQKNIHRTSRIWEIGQLAAGITHEFKNVVASMKFWISMKRNLREKTLDEEELDELQNICNRAEALIMKLLNLSRDRNLTMSGKNINTVISSSLDIIKKVLNSRRLNLNWQPGENLSIVLVHEESIGQVLLNLILNARDAMAEGGVLTIRTYEEDNFVKIDIKDTGTGIKKEILNKIFEPFFTTKDLPGEGKTSGAGLGLSVSYEIIRKHHGTLSVKSEAGKGSVFTISLPVRKVEKYD